MSCLNAINKIIRFECECPNCYEKIRSDDLDSPIFGLDIEEVKEINHGGELEIECHECGHKFTIDEIDWE